MAAEGLPKGVGIKRGLGLEGGLAVALTLFDGKLKVVMSAREARALGLELASAGIEPANRPWPPDRVPHPLARN